MWSTQVNNEIVEEQAVQQHCSLLIECVAVQTKARDMSLSDVYRHDVDATGAAVSLCVCWSNCHISSAPN